MKSATIQILLDAPSMIHPYFLRKCAIFADLLETDKISCHVLYAENPSTLIVYSCRMMMYLNSKTIGNA